MVKRYLHQAQSNGLASKAASTHSNELLEHILLEDNTKGRNKYSVLQRLFPDIGEELKKKGHTLHYL